MEKTELKPQSYNKTLQVIQNSLPQVCRIHPGKFGQIYQARGSPGRLPWPRATFDSIKNGALCQRPRCLLTYMLVCCV